MLGSLDIGFFQVILFVTVYRLSGGLVAVLSSAQTLMVLVFTWLIDRTMSSRAAQVWSTAGVLGVVMLALSPPTRYDGTGILTALSGAAAMALSVYLSRHRKTSLSVLAFAGQQLFIDGVFSLPIALLVEPPLESLNSASIGGYLYLCLFGVVFTYVLFLNGIVKLSPATISPLGLLNPVSVFMLGWLSLGQGMDAKSLSGSALMLVSIFST